MIIKRKPGMKKMTRNQILVGAIKYQSSQNECFVKMLAIMHAFIEKNFDSATKEQFFSSPECQEIYETSAGLDENSPIEIINEYGSETITVEL